MPRVGVLRRGRENVPPAPTRLSLLRGNKGLGLAPASWTGYPGFMSQAVETYRYITRTPGVCGGHARVDGSRIAVHDVIGLLQNGETVDSVTRELPGLTRAQVYECLAYYEDHLAELDYLIARQMAEAGA